MLERYLAKTIKNAVCRAASAPCTEEIRLRCDRPVIIRTDAGNMYVHKNGSLVKDAQAAVYAGGKDIEDTLSLILSNSVYAYKEDMSKGFVTLPEGHRAGICGMCVSDKEGVSYIRRVSSINIRIAREVKGCADGIIKEVADKNTVIISPPGCGKTTLLRDISRQLSALGKNVCIADERCELAPMYEGKYVFDTGICTDVLSGCDKAYGMTMLLRSMNPDVIVTDELTGADMQAVRDIMHSGVKVVASFHGENKEDFYSRSGEEGFETFILLDKNKKARVAYK